ncbi:methylmalonyl-CoA mutase family protein [Bacteriovoracaceae bacterium]|nr:methylmalonyl-CoA mutase family protein [Bacteriovoracaceae bacterium]
MEKSTGQQKVRFVTAASLFDGHDVSINIMRRILQSMGVEVIHLGHNRSVRDVVRAAICEDAHAVAVSSYQGGHNEYFAYLRELLDEFGGQHIKIFGGGGGVITLKEIEALHAKGVTRIYHPKDGMSLGLEGIVEDMVEKSQYNTLKYLEQKELDKKPLTINQIAQVITYIEDKGELPAKFHQIKHENKLPVLGITGTGGAGKSSLIDELLIRFNTFYKNLKIALVSVDPTKKKTTGALLGDRIRLNSSQFDQFYIRSLATRNSANELSPQIQNVVNFLQTQDFDLILVESSGIGQASDAINDVCDESIYVMTPEFGAATQLEKIEMLDWASFIVINKFEKAKGPDAYRDVVKQYSRNHKIFNHSPDELRAQVPVYGTCASKFNDTGVNKLFYDIASKISLNITDQLDGIPKAKASEKTDSLISGSRINYLQNIADAVRNYNDETEKNYRLISDLESLTQAKILLKEKIDTQNEIEKKIQNLKENVDDKIFSDIDQLKKTIDQYEKNKFSYQVRGKDIKVDAKFTSLSGLNIPRIGTPKTSSSAALYKFMRKSNLPGNFPYAGGVFPFKRKDEDPKRMFAGEGGPTDTNKRFHFLSKDEKSKRLSTAFDSVTLYGQDPDHRPDIYGKVGESGVSIATLSDMQKLFDGFDLTSPSTSVSMTINGPAPIILAMFMNAAINQNLKEDDRDDIEKCIEIMRHVRGTVQADILKEDQAQNTCIFSLEFALKLMGDVQEFFSSNKIFNYYTVSISGYHIAEAGANPISQTAFTLSNGFTYVEYYLKRKIPIDDFAQNLSFFFSNGLDPEYSVIGRVARKIWAIAIRDYYGGSQKSQKLKYHIQTSGRSLHAQEMAFNDIRTTLQAYLAISDACNSLHTNAYDEAITTPTEESVRRAMAIQLIINREFGLNKVDNPMQGSYILEELADLVEEAILIEFENISRRGGVLGAMENMYQRGKIQEESLYYETLKDSGDLPIIGVNSYIPDNIEEQLNEEINLIRSSTDQKEKQIENLNDFQKDAGTQSEAAIERLKKVALNNENIFQELLYTTRYCSLGQISNTLFEIGGEYRRSM